MRNVRVGEVVVDYQRLTGEHDLTGDALPGREFRTHQRVSAEAACRAHDQPAAALIQQAQHRRVGAQQLAGAGHNHVEDPPDIGQDGDLRTQAVEGFGFPASFGCLLEQPGVLDRHAHLLGHG